MENEQRIAITNGVGSIELVNGTYNVGSQTLGYSDTSILPIEQEVTEGVNTYNFTIAATGTLTLHVSDDGTDVGIPIVGAKFIRCDSNATTYGTEIVTDDNGDAVFNNVPFDASESAPLIYYKQTASDGNHTFDDTLKSTSLQESTATVQILNEIAPSRTFNLTDVNYEGLPIADGEIILS